MAATVDEVDLLRSRQYDLLATLLGRVPCGHVLAQVSGLEGDGTPLGQALGRLGTAARNADPLAIERDHFETFVGVGRGRLLPYASYYLTGFLNERPLARVRADFDALGIERSDALSEPEDHVAILLEVMAGLASGRIEAEPGAEARFFARHLQPWAPRFFADLAEQADTDLFRAVGALGQAFLEIEVEAFALDA
ncbi:molecular chaperone TorD family protein [Methylobacterium durans]|uniref:TorD/DmsD family molecular chaperone n=1 Tax=Methylobacterium durans TaxID=2202825 RepID=UPI002AFDCF4F|nr:molecular chaperone TorD family protein [Methylobacterium durans]MEA1833311.1 molecular chaperone TorD family protein [Methylobacterium durans]